MGKLGLFLAVIALGAGGYAVYDASERDARLDRLEQSVQEVHGSVTSLDARLEALLAGGFEAPADLIESGGTAVAAERGGEATGAEAGLATRAPATPAERLAALEKTVADQEETIAKLEQGKQDGSDPVGFARSAMNDRFYWNLDAAAKSMGLSDRQKADMKDLQERAQRDIDDVFAIANDEGVTWAEASKMKFDGSSSDGGVVSLMSNFKKAQEFKKSRIPGTNETYGEAETRIRNGALGEMRNLLTPKQVEKWDKAHKDGLVRSKSGGMSIAFGQTVIDSK